MTPAQLAALERLVKSGKRERDAVNTARLWYGTSESATVTAEYTELSSAIATVQAHLDKEPRHD